MGDGAYGDAVAASSAGGEGGGGVGYGGGAACDCECGGGCAGAPGGDSHGDSDSAGSGVGGVAERRGWRGWGEGGLVLRAHRLCFDVHSSLACTLPKSSACASPSHVLFTPKYATLCVRASRVRAHHLIVEMQSSVDRLPPTPRRPQRRVSKATACDEAKGLVSLLCGVHRSICCGCLSDTPSPSGLRARSMEWLWNYDCCRFEARCQVDRGRHQSCGHRDSEGTPCPDEFCWIVYLAGTKDPDLRTVIERHRGPRGSPSPLGYDPVSLGTFAAIQTATHRLLAHSLPRDTDLTQLTDTLPSRICFLLLRIIPNSAEAPYAVSDL